MAVGNEAGTTDRLRVRSRTYEYEKGSSFKYMAIRAVIFDIGDVLLLGGDDELEMKWTQRLRLQEGEAIQRLVASGIIGPANTGKITQEELQKQLGMIYQLDEEQLREFWDDNWSLQTPNTELIHFFQSLRPSYKTATLSNDWPGAREQQNRLYNLEEILSVDAMLYSCEEGMQKPNADFYLLACQRLDVQPEEALFIDDREICVNGALRIAMQGILFKNTEQVIADVQICLKTS
jgi:epoxide hydrolase-like predicted phosphatase